ncbi:hypothetical protein AB0F68_16555 [Micromonospora sp. NPDC023966]|uniref:hypothetical protein n=1 Tax=Micromonospora sp. NPDC023966 TaxID=3154699 RepID=UPI0033CDA301
MSRLRHQVCSGSGTYFGGSATWVPDVDRLGTTVPAEDGRCVRHWVWCDRLLDGGRRCPLPADHDGDCRPRGWRWRAGTQRRPGRWCRRPPGRGE